MLSTALRILAAATAALALAAGVALATRGHTPPVTKTHVRLQAVPARGATGARGPAGPKGDPGRPGADGSSGPPGIEGVAGAQGPAGPRGVAGPEGPPGAAGETGARGADGAAWPSGAMGPAGATGPQGAAGPQGIAGLPGVQGPAGPSGQGLASFDDVDGLRCTAPSGSGVLQVAYDSANHVTLTCTVAHPALALALVRVNEIATGTTTSAADEFVEIVNTGGAPADIGGWKLVYRSSAGTTDTTLATVPTGTTLAAGGFYLFGGSAYAGARAADQPFATGLAAAGGGVAIRDPNGALVDSAGWGTAANTFVEGTVAPAPPTTATPGSSIGRKPDGHDTNDNSADFAVAGSATPRFTNG